MNVDCPGGGNDNTLVKSQSTRAHIRVAPHAAPDLPAQPDTLLVLAPLAYTRNSIKTALAKNTKVSADPSRTPCVTDTPAPVPVIGIDSVSFFL